MSNLSELSSQIKRQAQRDYLANVVDQKGVRYLTAGSHQFHTLWVRDFCYSVPGLLSVDEQVLVKDQLALILQNMNSEGLLPRGLDVIPPQLRVVLNTIFRWLPSKIKKNGYKSRKLVPEYKGEHGTIAFDSLLLVPWAFFLLEEKLRLNNQSVVQDFKEPLTKVLQQLRAFIKDDLFEQPAFSDWQDSTKREGVIFTSHILFLRLKRQALALDIPWLTDIFTQHSWPTEKNIFTTFYSAFDGLFSNRPHKIGPTQFSLEAHAWVLQDGLFQGLIDASELYAKLKESELWQKVGVPVYPLSSSKEIAWTTKVVGLKRYHDDFKWSWLLAEAYKTSRKMGDTKEASGIAESMMSAISRDGVIYEVYRLNMTPVKTLLYVSEHPFSWGACKWLEALA